MSWFWDAYLADYAKELRGQSLAVGYFVERKIAESISWISFFPPTIVITETWNIFEPFSNVVKFDTLLWFFKTKKNQGRFENW